MTSLGLLETSKQAICDPQKSFLTVIVFFLDINQNAPSGHCQNGGYCDISSSRCICPPGYHGSSCEFSTNHRDPCENHPCIHGQCSALPDGIHCLCDDGYSGSFCDEGKDNCVNNNCRAGSKCINAVDSYYCDCPTGRTGQYCENIDCSAIPGICNFGKCIDSPLSEKSFECHCDPGYEGELCDTDINECKSENICMNNGTCVNLPGTFRCDCARGFGGKWCDVPLDMCQGIQCENGGKCIHTSDHSPVCQCKIGFIGKRCEKECPPGYGGIRCDIERTVGICSRKGATCFNGGKCLGGFCVCPPDFIGNQCEISRKAISTDDVRCSSDPCMNNATCIDVDAQIGYVCLCQPGFYGDICEQKKDLCRENPCGNGGICHQNHDSYSCDCPAGFYGRNCENEKLFLCSNSTCQNGGVCFQVGKISKCECSYGFTGAQCEEKIDLGVFNEKDNLLRSVCEKRKCWERANDGNCDADCNYAVCKFDGGDCSGKREPFSKCRYGNMCADLFANGECNQACNNEECLYDGMDCLPAIVRCPPKIREYCAARFGNGICDPECNTIGCGYDGGDCENMNSTKIISNIRIAIQMDPSEFQLRGGITLIEISSVLRATVTLQRDEYGPLVFGWDGESEKDRVQIDMKKLAEQKEGIRKVRSVSGVVVYLEVQENCVEGKCLYKDSQTVVDIISARLAKKGINSFGVPISEALVASPPERGFSNNHMSNTVLWICVGCLVVVAIAGTLTIHKNRTRKRRMISAPVWIPPMENEKRAHTMNLSQHTLLEGYYDAKRHCTDYVSIAVSNRDEESYNQFYTQPNPCFDINGNGTSRAPPSEIFQQAYGPDPISFPITSETVKYKDAKYGRTILHFLADNNSGKGEELIIQEAKKCIVAGAEIDVLDCDENTPIMLAVCARRTQLAVQLLRAGADPTIFNRFDRNALHVAAANQEVRMMEILLTDKRILRDMEELDKEGKTALMIIASKYGPSQVKMARLLIANGAKVDSDGASRKDSEIYRGRTALHYAALADNVQMLDFLISQNANKDKQDEEGRTAIMLAAKEGNENSVKSLLLHGASIEACDVWDHCARQLAQLNHHHNIVEIIKNYHPVMSFAQEMSLHPLQNLPISQPTRKTARATYKSTKKQPKVKKEPPSNDSTHLTPPPSDGSTSSPSPQHFMGTTHTTPPSLHYLSPEYQHDAGSSDAFQPQCSTLPDGETWYTASPMQNEAMTRYTEVSYY
ncbi:hypothetical protein CAEBREN_31590 [Caenorhabditis brenneri]|uniref:Uncharacterized protein n=1 Tax=Caenorhabditis brenneri TaxID=135651 RepID=G0NB08_CAEBE|nr:hypothetical protein CAEBREN_31590 [Caenorhabditis brenneri]